MQLNKRNSDILSAVIRAYIITGEPVGSKQLLETEPLNCSSATIRAKMSELCELGLLNQPHTSAGRVPTAKGYRYFISELIKNNTLSDEDKRIIDSLMPQNITSPDRLIDAACSALADYTGCAAMLTTPSDKQSLISEIRLIDVGYNKVMLVLIASNGMISNSITRCDENISPEALATINEILKSQLIGTVLEDFTPAAAQSMLSSFGKYALLTAPILAALYDAAADIANSRIHLSGESYLISHREFANARATGILKFLHSKREMLSILSQFHDDINVVLGNETGEAALTSSGVVATKYYVGGKELGSIGILGPDRMDYEHIIPGLLYFRKEFSKMLSESLGTDIRKDAD